MKVKAILIEDESSAQKHITKLLLSLDKNIVIEKTMSTVEDAVTYLKYNSPDIIFMDIHLSDGLSFDILEEVEINCPIIFTTAYDKYAIKAFKTSGIDYLLKPITSADLKSALNKYYKQKTTFTEELFLKKMELLNLYNQEPDSKYIERFLLKLGNSLTPVKTKNIAYFYRDEIVFAKNFDGKSFPVDDSLNQLQKKLNPKHFVRLSRQLLINIEAIKKLTPSEPGQVTIEVNPKYHEVIQISKERTSFLKNMLSAK